MPLSPIRNEPFAFFDLKNALITDPSIFDFYNKLIDGPNKHEFRSFEAFNVVLSQTFWKNRAGLEAAFDQGRYRSSNRRDG